MSCHHCRLLHFNWHHEKNKFQLSILLLLSLNNAVNSVALISLSIFSSIYQVFFPTFLQSDIYYKYLNELLNSVSESPNPSETSEPNDSTPTKHSHNTDESTRLVNSFGSDLDLTENPDAIWHRPNAG